MNVKDVILEAVKIGACSGSNGVTDWKSLCWLFFTPQGREFCEDNAFPTIGMFRDMKDHVKEFGVYVDAGNITRQNDTHIAVIGDTCADLAYDNNTKVHKVILMHGAKARIKACHYAVILLVNIGKCEVEIDKDQTSIVL